MNVKLTSWIRYLCFWTRLFIYSVCWILCFNLLLLCQCVLIGPCLLYVLVCCQTLSLAIHTAHCTVKYEAGFKTLLTKYSEDKIITVKPQGSTTVEDKLVVGNWFRRESVNWTHLALDRLQWQVFVAIIIDLQYHISARIDTPLERLELLAWTVEIAYEVEL